MLRSLVELWPAMKLIAAVVEIIGVASRVVSVASFSLKPAALPQLHTTLLIEIQPDIVAHPRIVAVVVRVKVVQITDGAGSRHGSANH